MAGRIRSIKPEVIEDERAASLPNSPWRLWVSMWVLADDYGNCRAGERYLAASCWQDTCGERLQETYESLRELQRRGFVSLYLRNGQRYAHINGWEKHQRIDNAGKPRCPLPTDDACKHIQLLAPHLAAGVEVSRLDLRPPTSDLRPRPPTTDQEFAAVCAAATPEAHVMAASSEAAEQSNAGLGSAAESPPRLGTQDGLAADCSAASGEGASDGADPTGGNSADPVGAHPPATSPSAGSGLAALIADGNGKPQRKRRRAADEPTIPGPTRKEAEATIAAASGGRYVAGGAKVNGVLALDRIRRAHPDGAIWRCIGEWLAAGGEHWRVNPDGRALADLDAWVAQAKAWEAQGRPIRAGPRNGYRGSTTLGMAPPETHEPGEQFAVGDPRGKR